MVDLLSPVSDLSQAEKFAELSRALECDEDEARWEEKLKAVAKHRTVPEKPDHE